MTHLAELAADLAGDACRVAAAQAHRGDLVAFDEALALAEARLRTARVVLAGDTPGAAPGQLSLFPAGHR